MTTKQIHAVTGAFGYSGKYITQRLLDKGLDVITLTNSVQRTNPFGERVKAYPFNFDDPLKLAESLKGVSVLYNTYWVRFNHKMFTQVDAVENTLILFDAAQKAGVERIVHISITNPSEQSPLEYFYGKARLERALVESGMSYAILRPAILFGKEDILVNNIAWALRHLPVFGVFGDGKYCLQPIYVDDLAEIAVAQGESRTNTLVQAIGPETFVYGEMIKQISKIIGVWRPVLAVPPAFGYLASYLIGKMVNDVFVTRTEIEGLMGNLLYVDAPPAGKTRMTDWAKSHANELGRKYASELERRRDRVREYKPG